MGCLSPARGVTTQGSSFSVSGAHERQQFNVSRFCNGISIKTKEKNEQQFFSETVPKNGTKTIPGLSVLFWVFCSALFLSNAGSGSRGTILQSSSCIESLILISSSVLNPSHTCSMKTKLKPIFLVLQVFRGTEETPDQHAFVAAALAMSNRQRKDGSTSSTSTVMDTRPLIKNRSPGHIVKPISPTDEQAIDSAIQYAKDLASKTLQQDQSPVATPTRKHGPRFFIFNSKGHHHEKKNFSEMLEHTKQIQDALPREFTDVYSALVEKGEITCNLEDSPPADSRTYSNCTELVEPPPPLPPKPAVKTKTESLRHHRRIHPLVLTLPGYEQQDANNNNTFKAPVNGVPASQTLPRLPAQIPPRQEERPRSRPTSRSNESLLRSSPLHSFGSSESLPCRPEIRHFRSIEPLLETRNRPSNSTQSLRAESSRSFDRMDMSDATGARPKKKLDRHVSCEDLLDFSADRTAARRTQGRQRGTESDEVHIMQKVLAYENLPSEDCLAALNITEWDVHKAIKLAKLRLLLAKRAEGAKLDEIPFSETKSVLETTNWNLEQAVQAIMGLV